MDISSFINGVNAGQRVQAFLTQAGTETNCILCEAPFSNAVVTAQKMIGNVPTPDIYHGVLSSEEVWAIPVPSYGTYQVTASKNGMSVTGDVTLS